ncbi:hypothetical protein VNI00_012307 [Paramarasmius palmivorus]|uniref:Uncharacterized protein n=1 Tax=Paramarasmius palmivorus TaxID=297713 RepID=A0AAW0C675_9AGAR
MTHKNDEQYEALLTSEEDLENPQQERQLRKSGTWDKKLLLILVLALSNFLFFVLWVRSLNPKCPANAQILYSPVQDILEYQVITFNATDGRSRHPDPWSQPLSDKLDEAWEGLYNECAFAVIPSLIKADKETGWMNLQLGYQKFQKV